MPIALAEDVCRESIDNLNQLLADTMTLRDLYKKHHWQVAGPTFYMLHLLFDKHYGQQIDLVDALAERIQLLGGVCVAMAHGRRGDDADSAAAEGTRGSASSALSIAACPRNRPRRIARDGAARRGSWRRWNQRPPRQHDHPDERAAGVVRGRARRRYAARARSVTKTQELQVATDVSSERRKCDGQRR